MATVQKNNFRALVGVLVDRDLGYSGTKFFHIMILNLVRQSARWVSGTSGFGFLLTHSVSLSFVRLDSSLFRCSSVFDLDSCSLAFRTHVIGDSGSHHLVISERQLSTLFISEAPCFSQRNTSTVVVQPWDLITQYVDTARFDELGAYNNDCCTYIQQYMHDYGTCHNFGDSTEGSHAVLRHEQFGCESANTFCQYGWATGDLCMCKQCRCNSMFGIRAFGKAYSSDITGDGPGAHGSHVTDRKRQGGSLSSVQAKASSVAQAQRAFSTIAKLIGVPDAGYGTPKRQSNYFSMPRTR